MAGSPPVRQQFRAAKVSRAYSGFSQRSYLAGAFALAAAVICGRAASAQTTTITTSGFTSYDDIDTYGYFGPPGGNISNLPFSATISYMPLSFTTDAPDDFEATLPGAMISSLTINNKTYTFSGAASPTGGGSAYVSFQPNYYGTSQTAVNLYNDDNAYCDTHGGGESCGQPAFVTSYATSSNSTLSQPGYPAPASGADQGNEYFYLYSAGNSNPEYIAVLAAGSAITFNGNDVSTLPQPIPVVVGQPIQLMGQPAPTQSQPWSIPGSLIGTYSVSDTCPGAPLEKGISPPVCVGTETPPVLTGQTTNFYWSSPGTFTVSYTANGSITKVAFVVSGPMNPNIVVDQHNTTPRTVGRLQTASGKLFLGCTPQSCITFTPTTVAPQGVLGHFSWIQTLSYDNITETGPGSCSYMTKSSLDNTYPYPFSGRPADGPQGTDDNPSIPLDNLETDSKQISTVTRRFKAKMYWMWQADLAGSIPVSLGYVTWNFTGSIAYANGVWSSTPSPVNVSEFISADGNPTWATVSVNNNCNAKH